MKKIISLFVICGVLLLTACSSGGSNEQTTLKPETTAPQTESIEDVSTETTTEIKTAEETTEIETINTEPEKVSFDTSWEFANESAIHSGQSVLYKASSNRRDIVVGVNAGHGTEGGANAQTYCHPDHSPKVTGGSTAAGATKATAVAYGMTFNDGTPEHTVTLQAAKILKEKLLAAGYDVLMVRDDTDVQLDNVARTVMCNNIADCHIALHWDGDGLTYDKGCFYCSVPEGLKSMYPVSENWEKHNALGNALIEGLRNKGKTINGNGTMDIDLTQTSYSKVPSVDIELGNQCSAHDDGTLSTIADGLVEGVNKFFAGKLGKAK